MDTLEKLIIDLYEQGLRPSRIVKSLGYPCGIEKAKEIIDIYRKEKYLSQELNGVSYGSVQLLYLEEKSVFDILQVYPELTYGEAKNIIGDYYQMLGIKKPYSIPFPTDMIKIELKTKTLEEVSVEYDIPVRIIKDKMNISLTKEEFLEKKMQILETDVNKMKPKDFENKYKKLGLKHADVKRLVKEYKNKK